MRSRYLPLLAAAAPFFLAVSSQGAAIANWKVLVAGAGTVTTTSGLNTDSPVFGDGTANDMDAVQLAGRFGTTATPESASLAVGETLTVSATITLTGGTSVNGHYRIGVFDDGGQFAASSEINWAGGWLHQFGGGTGTTTVDLFKANTSGSLVSTTATSNASALTATNVTTGTLNGDSILPYLWTMTITRDSATTVDLMSRFVGGDGGLSHTLTANDVTTSLFTYTSVGMLTSGATDLDQLSFSQAQFSVVPEPSSVTLFGLAGVGLLVGRRRR